MAGKSSQQVPHVYERNTDFFYETIAAKIKLLETAEAAVGIRNRLHQLIYHDGKSTSQARLILAEEFYEFQKLKLEEQWGVITRFIRSDLTMFSDIYDDTLNFHNYIYETIFDFADTYGVLPLKLKTMRQRERLLKPFSDDFVVESFQRVEQENISFDKDFDLDKFTIGELKEFDELLNKCNFFDKDIKKELLHELA